MYLLGTLRYKGVTNYCIMKQSSSTTRVYVVSSLSKGDRARALLGKPLEDTQLTSILSFNKFRLTKDYVIAGFVVKRYGGDLMYMGNKDIVDTTLALLSKRQEYTFKPDEVIDNHTEVKNTNLGNVETNMFAAKNDECSLEYSTDDGIFNYYRITYKTDYMGVDYYPDIKIFDKITMSDFTDKSTSAQRNYIKGLNLPSITMADLNANLDMSWYNGKSYKSVKTKEEFEAYVMQPLTRAYREAVKNGEELLFALDTETTGLNIYNLKDSNPDKSHICATPLSWEDNQGVVVFNAMKYFSNISPEYMLERLKPFLEEDGGDVVVNGITTHIDRKNVNLIGHNVMYDGRVLYDNGTTPIWDNDTMQMAFNLDPKAAKGRFNNKLKGITRRLFGHETPELTDILGKGNEDKYSYLQHEEVAVVYGCADADYTRLVYKSLRAMMSDEQYKVYRQQDMPMINQLYISEYNGLKVDGAEVAKLADILKRDLDLIHNFLQKYAGNFIAKKNKITNYRVELDAGTMTPEEYSEAVNDIEVSGNEIYEFSMKASEYRRLFDKFNYPVLERTDSGEVKTDKYVLKKLQTKKLDTPSTAMKEDLVSEDGSVLLSAETFNSLKYPLAYAISQYKSLEKEYTSYYKPFVEMNMEDRLFKSYSMSRIETFRIMNPLQTIKSNLKELVKPFDDDYYLMDFDMAQVEYRIMVSLAHQNNMVERLKDPENDFHTESAAAITETEPHLIDKKTRKQFKAVNFGIPYGLSDYNLCDKLFGNTKKQDMVHTRLLKQKFEDANKNVIASLTRARDKALIPVELSHDFKKFCGYITEEVDVKTGKIVEQEKPVGMVQNLYGRYRLFDLSNMDKKKEGDIRRAAGNFPIQATAAELFRIILIRFANRCKKEGITDKIKWNMLIHDELLLSVHKSLNPYYMYKLIEEECMVTFPGHTDYFVGINAGLTWAECKDDLREAPVGFVRQQKAKWDNGELEKDVWIDDPWDYVKDDMMEYFKNRIYEVFNEIQPGLGKDPIDFNLLLNEMKNYTVRNYLTDYFIPDAYKIGDKVAKEWYDVGKGAKGVDIKFIITLANWAVKMFGDDVEFLYPSGDTGFAKSVLPKSIRGMSKDTLDPNPGDTFVFEDLYDEDTGEFDYGVTDYDLKLMDNNDYYDVDRQEIRSIGEERTLNYIRDIGSSIRVNIRRKDLAKVKKALGKFVGKSGKSIIFRFKDFSGETWLKLPNDANLYEVDSRIREAIEGVGVRKRA